MSVFDCTSAETREAGIAEAARVLGRGGLIVLPTDTVYGLGANAFDPDAVAALLAAKGRGRDQPPPVLVAGTGPLTALTTDVPDVVIDLVAAHWPGPLTVICRAQPMLAWDLGDTAGTVALRMPDDEIALELLATTGPLAVSSANRATDAPATSVLEAATALGDAVGVYLDGGPSRGGVASTIIDATGPQLRIVRDGALSRELLARTAPELADDDDTGAAAAQENGEPPLDGPLPDGPPPADLPPGGELPGDPLPDERSGGPGGTTAADR